jgi:hypothetical protein
LQSSDDYRSVYCRLLDDPDFQALSPDAQRLWFFLRFCQECGPTGLFRFYPPIHCLRMGIDEKTLQRPLDELCITDWIRLEGGYILVRNAMRFEPTFRPRTDPKHLKAVHRHVGPLRKLAIAHDLLMAEGLPEPIEWSNEGPPRPKEGPKKPHRSTAPAPAPEPAPATAPATVTATARASGGQETPPEPPTATTTSTDPELPPDDGEGPELPPVEKPLEVTDPEANANPWHPDDEEEFGRRDKPHPRWQDYVEVHMAIKAPAPWPRFWEWIDQDSKRRANAPPVRIFQRVTNPVHEEGPLDGAGGAHAKAG